MFNYEQWDGFEGRLWKEEINTRDFIQKNYTPYDGDASFLAGPTEATAIGNIMMQAKALEFVGSLAEIREIVCHSANPVTYMPQDTAIWDEAYKKFIEICQ